MTADLREVKQALRESMLAHLQEARGVRREGEAQMFESIAIKRALLASAVDGVLTERRSRWAPCSSLERSKRPPAGVLSATRAERRLLEASARLKRDTDEPQVEKLAAAIERASGGQALESLSQEAALAQAIG